MYQNRIVTLTSDFGLSDVYVGVMKGAIAQINPTLTVVDLTHEIPPQNLTAARFCLMNAYPYFPKGTVHIAVVDPGVGSSRRAIAVKLADGFLVGPDNGLFSGILSNKGVSQSLPEIAAVELTNPDYWRATEPSSTFHGRDIFAPVGAHLASGVPLEQLGDAIDLASLVQLPIPECVKTEAGITGCIQYIDRFGNLITNIPGTFVQGKIWSVVVGFRLPSCQTYSDSPIGEAIALIGSHGWVEIAVNGGNAQSQLQLDWGDEVLLQLD
ncbi:SAM-dependent chlorinase/fluorinase [Coleofasciculus sp. FACHB-SPT9]|uniref:SAM hydrolase/SAM-dependent halogenase family protein n=1 Tax=Cyanophyceae TaxID=3028117 RepID=UPI0016868A3C|nr:SAM-dependent chlorinase/fluorinase [Coleofasciculus sp. FACHB-SPT9]MBD1890399.1 SAM-dependent chlorinase/fluorinase [Coleofasciculus sp. FACHB-SPT9]